MAITKTRPYWCSIKEIFVFKLSSHKSSFVWKCRLTFAFCVRSNYTSEKWMSAGQIMSKISNNDEIKYFLIWCSWIRIQHRWFIWRQSSYSTNMSPTDTVISILILNLVAGLIANQTNYYCTVMVIILNGNILRKLNMWSQ